MLARPSFEVVDERPEAIRGDAERTRRQQAEAPRISHDPHDHVPILLIELDLRRSHQRFCCRSVTQGTCPIHAPYKSVVTADIYMPFAMIHDEGNNDEFISDSQKSVEGTIQVLLFNAKSSRDEEALKLLDRMHESVHFRTIRRPSTDTLYPFDSRYVSSISKKLPARASA